MWVFQLVLYRSKNDKGEVTYQDEERGGIEKLLYSSSMASALKHAGYVGWEIRNAQVSQVSR